MKRQAVAAAGRSAKSTTAAKRAAEATPAKPARTARSKPATSRSKPSEPTPSRRPPTYDEISERAYFIALEQGGGDEVANWLRAERELTTA